MQNIHIFSDCRKLFTFIAQHECENESNEPKSLKFAQDYIRDQLSSLAGSKHLDIDSLLWDQRENDWQSEIHYVAVYIADRRYALAFSQMELTIDQGTTTWERIILDKIQWFINDYIPTKQPQRYQHLDAGKSWIENQLTKHLQRMGKPSKVSINTEDWKNPDELRSARSSEKNNISLDITVEGHEISLYFTASEVENCIESKDIQDKISRYLEAKLIYMK